MSTAVQKSKPRFARVEADLRRQMLIDAAIRCLAEGGIAAFTVDRISREAKVSRGLINHHFNGISGLLIEVYEAMTQSMLAAGRETLFFEGTAEERLAAELSAAWAARENVAQQLLRHVQQDPEAWQLYGSVLAEVDRMLDELAPEHRSRRLMEELDRASMANAERMGRIGRFAGLRRLARGERRLRKG